MKKLYYKYITWYRNLSDEQKEETIIFYFVLLCIGMLVAAAIGLVKYNLNTQEWVTIESSKYTEVCITQYDEQLMLEYDTCYTNDKIDEVEYLTEAKLRFLPDKHLYRITIDDTTKTYLAKDISFERNKLSQEATYEIQRLSTNARLCSNKRWQCILYC